MRKKFAPLALLFALLGTLLLGGASVANAASGWDCSQKQKGNIVKVDVNCVLNNNLNNITVNVYDVRVLNNNEIVKLENVLNNTSVNIEDIEAKVLNVFINDFKINISDINVKVCAVVVGVLFKQCT